jgi:hypothetical protein
MWAFGIAFGVSGAGTAVCSHYRKGIGELLFWLLATACATLYVGGAMGAFAAALTMCFRLRCPICGNKVTALNRRWKYCPYCGVDLHSPLEEPRSNQNGKGPVLAEDSQCSTTHD